MEYPLSAIRERFGLSGLMILIWSPGNRHLTRCKIHMLFVKALCS